MTCPHGVDICPGPASVFTDCDQLVCFECYRDADADVSLGLPVPYDSVA